jgi:Heterokaryon incompatibility protein (HET)
MSRQTLQSPPSGVSSSSTNICPSCSAIKWDSFLPRRLGTNMRLWPDGRERKGSRMGQYQAIGRLCQLIERSCSCAVERRSRLCPSCTLIGAALFRHFPALAACSAEPTISQMEWTLVAQKIGEIQSPGALDKLGSPVSYELFRAALCPRAYSRHSEDIQMSSSNLKLEGLDFRYPVWNAFQLGRVPEDVPESLSGSSRSLCGRPRGARWNASLVKSWIERCADHHESCHFDSESLHLNRSDPLSGLEVRLIDVNQRRLVSFRGSELESIRYVALSYVWGIANQTIRLNRGNIVALHRPGGLPKLSKTIEDAIMVAQQLGERFLWCDAICIIQDESQDKQASIAGMHVIYLNAYMTIINASDTDANDGICGVSWDRPPQRAVVVGDLALYQSALQPPFKPTGQSSLLNTRWSDRAWTFQEQYLSRRKLIFLKEQVCWSCKEATWLEDTELECDKHEVELLSDHGLKRPNSLSLGDFPEVLRDYSRRQMTDENDVENALVGILSTSSEKFYWGLPECDFEKWLCWRMSSAQEPFGLSRRKRFPAPTWSWMAWKGAQTWDYEELYPRVRCMRIMSKNSRRAYPINDRSQSFAPRLTHIDVDASLKIDERHIIFYASVTSLRLSIRARDKRPGEGVFIEVFLPRPRSKSLQSRGPIASIVVEPSSEVVKDLRRHILGVKANRYQLFDFVEIGLTAVAHGVLNGTEHDMLVMLVTWRDGIAYREGLTSIFGEDWARLGKKKRLVILG